MTDWEQFDTASNYIKFTEPGEEVVGTIREIRVGSDFNQNKVPELILDTPLGQRTLTVVHAMLKAALVAEAPEVGDRVKITFTGLGTPKPGRQAPRLYTVEVKRQEKQEEIF